MATNGKEELFVETLDSCNDDQQELEESSPKCDGDLSCQICHNKLVCPRLLTCLHVFCQSCLEKKKTVEHKRELVVCPTCKQQTPLGRKGVQGLVCDYISTNMQDMLAITSANVPCTSCKTKELAVARCCDCANFLCPNCNTAHQFMLCFKNHKVVSIDSLMKDKELVSLHRPINCETHTTEPLKFFCYTCMVPICNECVVVEHCSTQHNYERLSDAYERQKAELCNLMTESKAKVSYCEEANNTLQNSLDELQSQHDNAKGLINETFQSYKALLEKKRDEILDELKELHSERELKIMEMFHCIDKTLEQIEDANKYTCRLLEHGNAAEVLSLRQLVSTQLLNLINNTPKPDVNTSLEFLTDMDKFSAAIQATFGHFRKDMSVAATATTTPQQDSPPPALSLMTNNLGCPPSSVTSSPVSMPSSYEGEIMPNLMPFTRMQEYNLSALATLSTEPPSPVPSSTRGFILNDLFNGDPTSTSLAIKNLETLALLDNQSSMNDQEIVNGHGLPPSIGRMSPLADIPPRVLSPNGVTYLRTPTPSILPPPSSGSASMLSSPGPNNTNAITPVPYPLPSGDRCNHSPMNVRFKFGTLGPQKGQFNSPHGFCLGVEEDIIVADTNNHRVQVFEKNGAFKFQFGNPGKEEGQLWYPRKVAVMKASGKFVVCDRGNERSRMQIFTRNGHFIKKIAIRYIDIVAGLAVSNQGHIVAVDSVSPTVFVISDSGDLLSWFDCSDHMREPSDLAISGREFYVCDFKGHCVVVFNENGTFLRRIGHEKITNFPNGIDISDAGDILVGDSHGNRFHVAVFSRNGQAVCEFECPYVKVSRCCGLKLTSEGYIVTLAKNNHHVLVLNTIYIA